MPSQDFGIRRSKETTKPKIVCPKLVLYHCKHCGNVLQVSIMKSKESPMCCNERMEQLEPKSPSEVSDDVLIDYKITGGYDENAIQVFWKIKKEETFIQWIYLRTFTGGQLKYVTNPKKTSFVFALADEDAYAYCDEDPCLECNFRCKRGFEIYVYIAYPKGNELVRIPLERMHANWQS